jgi:rSAM/selenodomain-associated transferase 1
MAKAPAPGTVKTRLQPDLSPTESAELYRCLLEDRIAEMTSLPPAVEVALAYSPASSGPFFAGVVPPSFSLFPQHEGTLSERLVAVVESSFASRRRAVAVIDSDSPGLTAEGVRESFRLLDDGADAVFGPCRDGGYYLAGLREPKREIFEGIPWSTSRVLAATLDRAAGLGLRTALLGELRDIDRLQDLAAFYHDDAAAGPGGRTRRFAEALSHSGRLGLSTAGSRE